MVKVIGNFKLELYRDLITIKNATTNELIKGVAVNPNDAKDKFETLCKSLEKRTQSEQSN
jgi:hypothetical protein